MTKIVVQDDNISWSKNTFIKFQKQLFADDFQSRCS